MNLLGINIVNAAFSDVESGFTINPHMTFREHFMSLGIIARRVGVNVGIAGMNGDIPVCDGDPVFVSRLATGSNFDWLIFRSFKADGASSCASKKQKKKNRCLRSHGAPQSTARPSSCKG